MINHARTLLLNSSGSSRPLTTYPGEELVPATYKKISLSGGIKNVWTRLFGADPDNLFMNYRLNQILRAVHSTDYAEYLYTFDSRITYETTGPGLFEDFEFGVSGRNLRDQVTIHSESTYAASETLGRAEARWTIELDGSGGASIYNIYTRQTTETRAVLTNGLTEPISLQGSEVVVQLETPSPTAKALVIASGRPTADLADIVESLENSVTTFGNDIFGIAPSEPYLTFYGLWHYSRALPERLAGVVLSLVYRLNDLHTGAAYVSAATGLQTTTTSTTENDTVVAMGGGNGDGGGEEAEQGNGDQEQDDGFGQGGFGFS